MRRQLLVYIGGGASALERWPPFFRLLLTGMGWGGRAGRILNCARTRFRSQLAAKFV